MIPSMIHEFGRSWIQPDKNNVLIDKTHALMDKNAFSLLNEYSASLPSGVYPGKMWKRHDGAFDPKCTNPVWKLGWYGFSEKGQDYCSINFREIIVV